jgi:hypothetical protein
MCGMMGAGGLSHVVVLYLPTSKQAGAGVADCACVAGCAAVAVWCATCRERIHSLCVIDPVALGMFMPHLLHNFMYRWVESKHLLSWAGLIEAASLLQGWLGHHFGACACHTCTTLYRVWSIEYTPYMSRWVGAHICCSCF